MNILALSGPPASSAAIRGADTSRMSGGPSPYDVPPGRVSSGGIVFPAGDEWSWTQAYYRLIPGSPLYCAGADGSVWSRAKQPGNWRKLKPTLVSGRLTVHVLDQAGKSRTRYVHALVLLAFVGPAPPGMQGCHFPNRDIRDNRLDNLRWDTPAGNTRDKFIHGTVPRGSNHGRAKLTDSDVAAIRVKAEAGRSLYSIAKEFQVAHSTISRILLGERRSCGVGAPAIRSAHEFSRRTFDAERVREIRELAARGHDNTEIAKRFRVGRTTISRIVRGLSYEDV